MNLLLAFSIFIFSMPIFVVAGPSCSMDTIKSLFKKSQKEDLIDLANSLGQKNFEKAKVALDTYQETYSEYPKIFAKAGKELSEDRLVEIKKDGTWVVRKSDGKFVYVLNAAKFYSIQKNLADPAVFHEKTRMSIKNFPEKIRKEFGQAIFDLQDGKSIREPLSKIIPSVGPGVSELRVKTREGNYRVFYYKNAKDKIIVFHAFHKKTEELPKNEIDIAKQRLREILDKN